MRNRKEITWTINEICNFNCEYCFQTHIKQALKPINIKILSKGLDNLGKDWLILITGGEPFLEKNFVEICQEVTKKHYLVLGTNLSTNNVYAFADNIDSQRCVCINTTVHMLEREKKDPMCKAFIEKTCYLQDKGFNVITQYIVHPGYMDRVEPDLEYLKARGVKNIIAKAFFGMYDGKYYPAAFTDEQRNFFKKLDPSNYEIEKINESCKYYGRLCTAGQKLFRMDRNGNITRCASSSRKYGNLFDKTINFDRKPRPCPKPQCDCVYDGIYCVLPAKGSSIAIIMEDIHEKVITFKFKDLKLLMSKFASTLYIILKRFFTRRYLLNCFWLVINALERAGIPFSKIKKLFKTIISQTLNS